MDQQKLTEIISDWSGKLKIKDFSVDCSDCSKRTNLSKWIFFHTQFELQCPNCLRRYNYHEMDLLQITNQ